MNSDQMKTQGARCPCGGSDDYCVCQNADLAALREQQKETAKDTYFAIAEYKAHIDWFEGELAKADEWKAQGRALEAKVAALTADVTAGIETEQRLIGRLNAAKFASEASEASAAALRTALAWRDIKTDPPEFQMLIIIGGWHDGMWSVAVSHRGERHGRRGYDHRNGPNWATHWKPLDEPAIPYPDAALPAKGEG